MGSSGFKWSFLKLLFREKMRFHLMTAISNTLGQPPLLMVCPPASCGDKSGFTITYGDSPVGGSSTRPMLAAQPDHPIGFHP
ncbi:hypothetical protein ACFX13_003428 [Malus domestica]